MAKNKEKLWPTSLNQLPASKCKNNIIYFFQEKFKSEFKERVFCNDLRRLCCPRLSNPEDEELALGAIPISQRTNGMELL